MTSDKWRDSEKVCPSNMCAVRAIRGDHSFSEISTAAAGTQEICGAGSPLYEMQSGLTATAPCSLLMNTVRMERETT